MAAERPRVVILGAGGHAAVVLEILALDPTIDVVGVVCPDRAEGARLGVPVLGDDHDLPRLASTAALHFIVGVGSVGDSRLRRELFHRARSAGLLPIRAVHPQAVVSASAVLGDGVAVMAGAVVNPRARVGDNCIVNTRAVVEHDCVLGAHSHVATGACLAGGVTIGEGAHVGAGASVLQGVRVGVGAMVGLGAAVVRDVPDGVTVVGVPARALSRRGRP